MGLFSPYQRKDKKATTVSAASGRDVAVDKPAAGGRPKKTVAAPTRKEAESARGRPKKTVPTPTRKEAEAARRERISPTLKTKAARARERASAREARLKAFEAKDQGSGRTLARDFVDSRLTVSEFLMPALLITILLTLVGQQIWGTGQASVAYQIMNVAMVTSYAMLLVSIGEIVLNWRRFKKLLAERLPRETTKGLLFYFVNRCISFRRLRQPKPVVKRGVKL